jgi:biotin operon repressor
MSERPIGEPFNPWQGSCGFWPADIVDRQRELGDGPKRVYRRLKSYAGKNGSCFPSQQTLAADLGKSERQVRRDLDELESAGLIAAKLRNGRRSNTYQFLWHSMFERTPTSGQANDLSGHGCPVDETSADRAKPHLSGRDRTDKTGVTGHPCPPISFREKLQETATQAAGDTLVVHARKPASSRKLSGGSNPLGATPATHPAPHSSRSDEPVEGLPALGALLDRFNVRVRPGQVEALIEAGRIQGLQPGGVLAFAEEKLAQKRDQLDPIFSVTFLIRAITGGADFRQWAAKRQRARSFFKETCTLVELPLEASELRDHLCHAARKLRSLSGYDEIASELDGLAAEADIQLRDLQNLDQRLIALEAHMRENAMAQIAEPDLNLMQSEVESKLGPHRGRMSQEQLANLREQYVENYLFESNRLPRLSLFFLKGKQSAA